VLPLVCSRYAFYERMWALLCDGESKTEGERSALPSPIIHRDAFCYGHHLVEVASAGVSANTHSRTGRRAVLVVVMMVVMVSAANDKFQILIR
jgi:hypothetical protein